MSYNVIQCLKMSYDVTKCLITSNNVLKVLKCLIECLKTSYHGFTTKSEKFWCRTYVIDQQYDFFVRNPGVCYCSFLRYDAVGYFSAECVLKVWKNHVSKEKWKCSLKN